MLHKYKEVVFVDEDVAPPKYRKIVDIEWNSRKPNGCDMRGVALGSSSWRQWKVVDGLFPAKHQEAIDELVAAAADDEDENPTLKAYFVNSIMFKMIKAVPAELQVRKIDGEEEEKKEED